MKKTWLALIVLALGSGAYWNVRHERIAAEKSLVLLRNELLDAARQFQEATNLVSRLEREWAARQASVPPAPSGPAVRTAGSNVPFGPMDGKGGWSEGGAFVWIEKRHITALGLRAFRAADSLDAEVTPEVERLITRLSRKFLEEHPEFGRIASLPPEVANELHQLYRQSLDDAAADLDPKGRRALQAAMQDLNAVLIPGRMSQPPAEYHFNEDAAVLLGLSSAEQDAVNRVTGEMVERYHALEQRYVMVNGEPSGDVAPGATQVNFKVASFPAEGAAIKGEWLAQIKSIVGDSRTGYLLQMSENWIRSDLGDFGEAERSITIREAPRSYGFTDKSSLGYYASMGTGGPSPIPAGWRHLIVRPANGGLPWLRAGDNW